MSLSTSPHVVEPRFPAAVDRYVNLGRFYDVEACKQVRDSIVAHTLEYQAAYARAYRALQAAGEVEGTLRELLRKNWDRERLEKRTEGILSRELGRWGSGDGKIERRFLGGLTCKGPVYRFDTVDALADRVYVLLDSWGLGDLLLRRTMDRAVARGYDVIACPDENHPDQLLHLIVPQLRLAFVTSREGMAYPGTAYRRLHLDTMLDSEIVKSCKTRCRFYRRMRQLMVEEAVENLREAKASHDLLEEDYHPFVDFQGVNALAEEEWQRIQRRL